VSYVLAIDVGGTFTDLVLADQRDGSHIIAKTPTTPSDPAEGVLAGIAKVMAEAQAEASELVALRYGTTAAVNALLTRSGATVGLLVTDGFREILHLARSQTPGPLVGWLNMKKPEPLADLELTVEITERTLADGTPETPLDEDQVRVAAARLVAAGAEAIAVVFLHSYANPEHEQLAEKAIASVAPDIAVALSSEVLPEYREYERAVTTVANAFVMPSVSQALAELDKRLGEDGWRPAVNVVRSDGGLMSTRAAAERPVATIFSGPSGGVAGALAISGGADIQNILTFDMGGTSTDVSVCVDGEAIVARETIVGDFPIRAASVDVRSIGAGGGSIATVPSTVRSLRVGPDSAGADPGPACYGRGGTQPTVTDANLLLGRLPDTLLGGELSLDRDEAERAIRDLASKLDLDPFEAAQGVIDIANESMGAALRVMSVERGLDPRGFALVAFGGAGPLHANALAVLLGCFPVVVPPSPGVLSAYGFQTVGHRSTFTRTRIGPVSTDTGQAIRVAFNELAERARAWLAAEDVEGETAFSCDLRFLRQGYELEVTFAEDELNDTWHEVIVGRFEEAHEKLYGFVPEAEVELVNMRVEAVGPSTFKLPEAQPLRTGDGEQARVGTQNVYVAGDWRAAGLYDRSLLHAGEEIVGPAIINQHDATTYVLPNHVAEVDSRLNLLVGETEVS
jgi:N-methylhydantoinase A